jgi:hypothetical protein
MKSPLLQAITVGGLCEGALAADRLNILLVMADDRRKPKPSNQ